MNQDRPPVRSAFDLGGPVLYPRAARAAEALLFASFLTYMLLSAEPVMAALGILYYEGGSSALVRIHLGSYLLVAALLLACWSRGNPLAQLAAALARARPVAFFLASVLFLLAYSSVRHGSSNVTVFIDALLMPAVGTLAVGLAPARSKRTLLYLLMGFLTLNAAVGLTESLLRRRLLPVPPDMDDPFRASALLGHPLASALVTGPALIAALGARGRRLLRAAWLALLWLALLAFGGRSAFAVTTTCLLLYLLAAGLARLRRGRFSYRQVAGGALAGVVFLTALAVSALTSGMGERIFGTLLFESSAEARLTAWDTLKYLNGDNLLFGMAPEAINDLTHFLGMVAIENFWLWYLLDLGVVGFVFFVAGLLALLGWLFRGASAPARLALVAFVIIASGSNSLSTKNPCTILVIALVMAWSSYQAAGRRV